MQQRSVTRIERFFVIVNLRAGGVRRHPGYVRALERALGTRGEVLPTATEDDLHAAVAFARRSNADTIGICGGDGSNVHALSSIARAWDDAPWPRIALLPAGTLNTAATNLGIARTPPARHARALLLSDSPYELERPLVRVNDYFGFIFGGQMVARVLDAYYGGRTGPVGAGWLAARIIGSALANTSFARRLFSPDEVSFSIDGGPWERRRVTALLASTVAAPAVKLRALPRAGENGCFQFIATECHPVELAPELFHIFAGLPLKGLSVDVLARQVRLQLGEGARWTVDGDIFEGSDVTLQVTEPVRLLIP